MELLLPTLQGKRVALMVNQSSLVGSTGTHLVDTLLSQGINIVRLFVPEHGLRGKVDAGKNVRSGVDEKTGLPVVSLYGQRKRPTPEMLADIDLLVFDLQDVGTRFYTYISSMHYLMESCAEEGKTFVVCDRPNPNDFIDGPILEPDCRSFIGVDPLPVAHGLTVGELALMIDGERWLRGGNTCHVKVIPMAGWSHGDPYELPVRPNEAMIREVHVYGQVAHLGRADSSSQHRGLGRELVEHACGVARAAGYGRVNVISSVGTREYYRRLGFADVGLYQRREL